MVFSTEMDFSQPRSRINGSQVGAHQGRSVCLLGNAGNLSQDGTSFTLTPSDGQDIRVKMQQPFQENIEGLIEIHGVVDGQNSVTGSHYVKFPAESAQNFDLETYNKALELMTQYPEHYIQGVQRS